MDASQAGSDSDPEPPGHSGRQEQAAARELPPTLARVFEVTAGLDEWTAEEQAWMNEHPKWVKYQQDFREALRRHEERMAGGHANRIRERRDTDRDLPERD